MQAAMKAAEMEKTNTPTKKQIKAIEYCTQMEQKSFRFNKNSNESSTPSNKLEDIAQISITVNHTPIKIVQKSFKIYQSWFKKLSTIAPILSRSPKHEPVTVSARITAKHNYQFTQCNQGKN